MTTIKDILNFFESFAPAETAMDFDNCGLLVGDKGTPVTKALVTLDITADVVSEAETMGCELIISHHPVIFQPIKRMNTRSVPYLLACLTSFFWRFQSASCLLCHGIRCFPRLGQNLGHP